MTLWVTVFPVLLVILTVVFLIAVIAKRWYAQALMVVASLGAVAAGVLGFIRLLDRPTDNDVLGAVLVGIALVTLLATGVSAKLLYFSDRAAK